MTRIIMLPGGTCLKWPSKPCMCDAKTAAQCPSRIPPRGKK